MDPAGASCRFGVLPGKVLHPAHLDLYDLLYDLLFHIRELRQGVFELGIPYGSRALHHPGVFLGNQIPAFLIRPPKIPDITP